MHNTGDCHRNTLAGRELASCRVIERLGQGGMGVVYKAQHLVLEKPVAFKILPPHLTAQPGYVERFLREARAAAKLEHPNIVQILNAGSEGDIHFIVMQYVDGEDLRTRLRREGRLPLDEGLRIAEEVARALSAAHQLGVVHRDIKPDNVMITVKGTAKVTDFGLAKDFWASSRLTTTGTAWGTPHYMSPEQCAGVTVDHRTDLYSLGVMLYEMLSGSAPFEADNPLAILEMHRSRAPAKLSARVRGGSDGVDLLVAALLAKNPNDRYQSADELLRDLDAVSRGRPIRLGVAHLDGQPLSGSTAQGDPGDETAAAEEDAEQAHVRRTPSLEVLAREAGDGVRVLDLIGYVDADTQGTLDRALEKEIKSGCTRIVINCSGLTYMNSDGVGAIIAGAHKVREAGGDIKIFALHGKAAAVFEIIGLRTFFQVLETEEEALAAFAEPVPEEISGKLGTGFLASNRGGVFHIGDCPAIGRIRAVNLVRFGSREEAERAGKKPCARCCKAK